MLIYMIVGMVICLITLIHAFRFLLTGNGWYSTLKVTMILILWALGFFLWMEYSGIFNR